MNRMRLGLLLLIPVAMLMVGPLVAHADGNTYFIEVECASQPHSNQFADASIVFLGHHILAICNVNSGFHDVFFSFNSLASGTVVGQALAGVKFVHSVDKFSPSGCEIYHEVVNDEASFASYDIWTSSCDG
jgi:hypothetical protein